MHFSVLVIGEDVDAALAPFQENNLGDCPEEYLEFYDVEDEYRESYEAGVMDDEHEKKRHPERYLRPVREVFPTFDAYMEEVYGERDPKAGRYGDWWNPNARWDWYEIGGRWTGYFTLKPGRTGIGERGAADDIAGAGTADRARKGDIDLEAMAQSNYADRMKRWDELERTGGLSDHRRRRDLDIPEGQTREQFEAYAREHARHCSTVAVLKDGEWFDAEGRRADEWDEQFSALLGSLPEDAILTVVDCHI
jgi:hypothetical protein